MKLTGIELETKRLRLVPLSADHVDLMLGWANDPAVIANSQFFRDHSDRPRILEFIEHNENDPYSAYFAAFVKPEHDSDGVGYAGNVHLLNINQIHKHCQGGITLRQEAWNHGFAQELMPAMMRWGVRFTGNAQGLPPDFHDEHQGTAPLDEAWFYARRPSFRSTTWSTASFTTC